MFASTQDPLNYQPRPYNDDNHTIWVGGAVKYVSQPSEIDFVQAREFVSFLSFSLRGTVLSIPFTVDRTLPSRPGALCFQRYWSLGYCHQLHNSPEAVQAFCPC
jgi:hypothetical protein